MRKEPFIKVPVKQSFDFAINMILALTGGYLIFHFILEMDFLPLVAGKLVYIIGLIIRKFFLKEGEFIFGKEGERILLSILFVAYLLNIFKINPNIAVYLPESLIINALPTLVFLTTLHLLYTHTKGFSTNKKMSAIAVFCIIWILRYLIIPLNNFAEKNSWLPGMLLGMPLLYIFPKIFGFPNPKGIQKHTQSTA